MSGFVKEESLGKQLGIIFNIWLENKLFYPKNWKKQCKNDVYKSHKNRTNMHASVLYDMTYNS